MRARSIIESVNFQRGKDPKQTLDIGLGITPEWWEENKEIYYAFEELAKEIGAELEIIKYGDRRYVSIKSTLAFNKLPMNLICFYDNGELHIRAKQYEGSSGLGLYDTMEECIDRARRFLENDCINESVNFERGQDPKDSLNIGRADIRRIQRVEKIADRFGFKRVPVPADYDEQMWHSEFETLALWVFDGDDQGDPKSISVALDRLSDDDDDDRYQIIAVGLVSIDEDFELSDALSEERKRWRTKKIRESLDFERGQDPKKSLNIGINQKIKDLEERFTYDFPHWNYDDGSIRFNLHKRSEIKNTYTALIHHLNYYWDRKIHIFFENEPFFDLISIEPLVKDSMGTSQDYVLTIRFNPNKLGEAINFKRAKSVEDIRRTLRGPLPGDLYVYRRDVDAVGYGVRPVNEDVYIYIRPESNSYNEKDKGLFWKLGGFRERTHQSNKETFIYSYYETPEHNLRTYYMDLMESIDPEKLDIIRSIKDGEGYRRSVKRMQEYFKNDLEPRI